MRGSDYYLRVRFASWIGGRLRRAGLTEADAGSAIGRRRGWLRRFVRGQRSSHDLTLEDAAHLVTLLGGDPDSVFREVLVEEASAGGEDDGAT